MKISRSLMGHSMTDGTRAKISAARRWQQISHTVETRAKIAAALHGKARPQIAAALRGNQNSLGRILSAEAKAKIGAANRGNKTWLGRHHTAESRRKMSLAAQNRTQEHIAKFLKGRYSRPNKTESRLFDLLENAFPGDWRYCGDGSVILGGKCPDFVNVNGQKSVVELFGDYWHRNDSEAARIAHFARFGYQAVIVWERELKNPRAVIQKIAELRRMGWRK